MIYLKQNNGVGGIKLNKNFKFSKVMILAVLVFGIFLSGINTIEAKDHSQTNTAQSEKQSTTKYTSKVMKVLRVSLGVDKHSTVKDDVIRSMKKVEVMDRYMTSFGKKVKGNEVRKAVQEVFAIDLDFISKNAIGTTVSTYDPAVMETLRLSLKLDKNDTTRDTDIMKMAKNRVLDRYSKIHNDKLSSMQYRVLINQIYGVNLDGISSLEHARVSIKSKGQWILQSDQDLIILSSSLDDVEVFVAPTELYIEKTGSTQLPASLIEKLSNMGFTYDAPTNAYYYANPTGESIPDAFKGQTLGSIVGTIATEFPAN